VGGVVCGVDEVGYSPLAGPIVAAAVVLPDGARPRSLKGLRDSKQLSAARREHFDARIRAVACVGVGSASVAEIDEQNVYQANLLAMARAVESLPVAPDSALVDGRAKPRLGCPVRAVVRGDEQSLSIAAASIVAKVHRDRLMSELAAAHPQYGWQTNVGYGTDEHYAALLRHGPTPHHRMSFTPLKTWFGGDDPPGAPRLRYSPIEAAPVPEALRLFVLRQDLVAIYDAGSRNHLGMLKNGRGGWRLEALGYDGEGCAQAGAGPLASHHEAILAEPTEGSLVTLLRSC
jgi:ribonuclease HII